MASDADVLVPESIREFLRCRVLHPLLRLLRGGMTPRRLAWSLALGIKVNQNCRSCVLGQGSGYRVTSLKENPSVLHLCKFVLRLNERRLENGSCFASVALRLQPFPIEHFLVLVRRTSHSPSPAPPDSSQVLDSESHFPDSFAPSMSSPSGDLSQRAGAWSRMLLGTCATRNHPDSIQPFLRSALALESCECRACR
jgi:hypothetical protein